MEIAEAWLTIGWFYPLISLFPKDVVHGYLTSWSWSIYSLLNAPLVIFCIAPSQQLRSRLETSSAYANWPMRVPWFSVSLGSRVTASNNGVCDEEVGAYFGVVASDQIGCYSAAPEKSVFLRNISIYGWKHRWGEHRRLEKWLISGTLPHLVLFPYLLRTRWMEWTNPHSCWLDATVPQNRSDCNQAGNDAALEQEGIPVTCHTAAGVKITWMCDVHHVQCDGVVTWCDHMIQCGYTMWSHDSVLWGGYMMWSHDSMWLHDVITWFSVMGWLHNVITYNSLWSAPQVVDNEVVMVRTREKEGYHALQIGAVDNPKIKKVHKLL